MIYKGFLGEGVNCNFADVGHFYHKNTSKIGIKATTNFSFMT